MKKALFTALVMLLFLTLGIAAASADTATLLVYMCGPENLQEAACNDLIEMAKAQTGEAVNIVVLAGGAKSWNLDGLGGNTRTLAVIRDGVFERLEDWGYASMGDPQSLLQFLTFGLTEYPADRTVAVLWNHGSGSEGGVCFDETANDDGLTIVEIDDVLSTLHETVPDDHIHIFGCDACMMASYEMAAMLSHHNIDYYVASEELVTNLGWYYTDIVSALAMGKKMSDEEICGVIIDSYMEAALRDDPYDYLTLSAVKLSEVGALEKSMEQFASVMSGQIQSGNLSAVRRGRSRLYTFGSFAKGSWDMVDLGAVLDTYAQFDAVQATEVKRCLSKAVILNSQTDNLNPCCGLSVLIPQDTANVFSEYLEGLNLSEIIPNWVDFISSYVKELLGGSHHFSWSDIGQIAQDSILTDHFISSSDMPFGWLTWDDETESYSEEAAEGEEIPVSDSSQGFTAVLPQEDLAYLDYVEGLLMMDLSDEEMTAYVDFGAMQNNLVDWQTGQVVSLYDSTWPVLAEQIVPLYDQTNNAHSRRSLIPVTLNGEYTYLVVVFPAGEKEGRIIGANAGYDENGLPIRSVTRLKAGDVIIPIYTMYYSEPDSDDLQKTEFAGDQIIWEDGMNVTYEDLRDEADPTEVLFCFVFNDIFGDYTMSDPISFTI